jgi:hypothetical protein
MRVKLLHGRMAGEIQDLPYHAATALTASGQALDINAEGEAIAFPHQAMTSGSSRRPRRKRCGRRGCRSSARESLPSRRTTWRHGRQTVALQNPVALPQRKMSKRKDLSPASIRVAAVDNPTQSS